MMFLQSQLSNGPAAPPGAAMSLPYNQSQLSMPQLGSLPLGTMAPSVSPPPMTVSPGLMGQPQLNSNFHNGMLPPSMAQPPMAMAGLQQPNMFPSRYMQGGPFSVPVTQIPGGFPPGQTPGVMVANNTAQQPSQANDKNNEMMKKVGVGVGKAVLKFGTKYALEKMGVDDSEFLYLNLIANYAVKTGFSGCRCSWNFDCCWGGTCGECGKFEKVGL